LLTSLPAALQQAAARGETETFVIGGGEIYALALPLTGRLYLTEVDTLAGCDVFFPDWNPDGWVELERQSIPAGPDDDFASTFRLLERESPWPGESRPPARPPYTGGQDQDLPG
jgi:dihydrofolate reductase